MRKVMPVTFFQAEPEIPLHPIRCRSVTQAAVQLFESSSPTPGGINTYCSRNDKRGILTVISKNKRTKSSERAQTPTQLTVNESTTLS